MLELLETLGAHLTSPESGQNRSYQIASVAPIRRLAFRGVGARLGNRIDKLRIHL
jgi:hypothetical protein